VCLAYLGLSEYSTFHIFSILFYVFTISEINKKKVFELYCLV